MKITLYIVSFVLFALQTAFCQYKAEKPATYQQMCYYAINKEKFGEYQKVKEAILNKDYKVVAPILRQMRANLKQFDLSKHNRAFEIWYTGNYTDFEIQVETAKESTLAFLKNYETRLKGRATLYYDHRMFLEQYLAFVAEHFYPDFWFMSMERYFSDKTVTRVKSMNKLEGQKLFENSEFFRPFDIFNDLAKTEEEDIKDYLDMDKLILDTTTFIPYSYVALDKPIAEYILSNFVLDDATQDIDTDRQISALKKMLKAVQKEEALLIGRLNLIELRRLKQLEKKAEKAEISGD